MKPELQLAEAANPADLPDYADWIAERKLDGVRVYTRNGRLHTRSGRDVTASFPEIDAPEHHVLDGEIVTTDFRFETANRRVQTERPFKVEMLAETRPAMLVVFDALYINDGDVRERPLTERQELIGPSLPSESGLTQITSHDDAGALWEQAETEEWEGIMLKDPDAPYRAGRGDRWLKVKNWNEAAFRILDYEHTDNDGFVIFVDSGKSADPQKVAVNGRDDQTAVQAGAKRAEVQFLERTDDGRLRKPSFKGVA